MVIEPIPHGNVVVIATGDRYWDNVEIVVNVLSQYSSNTIFVHGYADGADCTVDVVAQELGFKTIRCPAHWRHNAPRWVEVHGTCPTGCKEVTGRPAGVIRNQWMLSTYRPWLMEVIGFHDNISESKGTRDMIQRAIKSQFNVTLYTTRGDVIKNPSLTKQNKSINIKEEFFKW